MKLHRGGGKPLAADVVYDALVKAGDRGLTREEATLVTSLRPNTVRKSFRALLLAGRCERAREFRATLTGGREEVHKAAGRGTPALKLFQPTPEGDDDDEGDLAC